jgi:hypothetical protein
MVPAATTELMLRFFGDAATPDYSAAQACALRNAYSSVRESLREAAWDIEDRTDLQYDLGWSWWLRRDDITINLRLSFVGPYAALLDAQQTSLAQCTDVEALLEHEGFDVLGLEELRTRVEIWAPECEGALYEFLFEFDRGTPWAR